MFEFSIKSTKNVKSFSIVFDDDEVAQTVVENNVTNERVNDRGFDKIRTTETEQVVTKRPDIPEVSTISIAEELQNLSF